MPSKRYTLVLADRTTGVVRRFTVSLKPILIAARHSRDVADPDRHGCGHEGQVRRRASVRVARHLEFENANYRTATEQLAGQIMALQTAMSDLGAKAALDPSLQNSMDKLPAVVKNRAMGGPTANTTLSLVTPGLSSPENTFGLLKDLLSGLEDRLQTVRSDVNKRNQLAAATPSIWPTHGWLSSSMGNRSDPFTGEKDFHPGLDISADKGDPVYATADGKVVNAVGGRQLRQPRDSRSRLRPRDALRPPVGVQGQARIRLSSAAICSAWSARPAAPRAPTSITRSGPTAAFSIRCSCC